MYKHVRPIDLRQLLTNLRISHVARQLHGSRRVSLALLTLAAASTVLINACSQAQSAPAPAAPPAPEVSVAPVIAREVSEWDEFTGRLAAVDSVEVRPRVSGYIQKVTFTEGAEVRRGDVLFTIDPRPYEAELGRARAEWQRAVTRAELAQREKARAEPMLKKQAISQEEMDTRVSGEREAEANVVAAKAAVDVAELNLEFTRVTSPINGRVSRAEVTEGNLVSGGAAGAATLMTTVVSLDPIYAYFEGDEQVYLKYAGQASRDGRRGSRSRREPVFLGLANEQGHPHEGYLDFMDNQLDASSGTIRVRAVFANKERLFAPGLFARIKLTGGRPYAAILIDDRAIGTDQDKRFVLRVGANNTAEYQGVELGPIVDGLRIVRSGLKPGDRIIVNGLQRVRPGSPVAPKDVPMEGAPTPGEPANVASR